MTTQDIHPDPARTASPERRLRIAHLIVQPVLVWDDGQELTPGPETSPVQVPVSRLGDLAERLPVEIAQLEAKANAS